MPMNTLIGTSGWSYNDWQVHDPKTRIPFYPTNLEKYQRLAYYSEVYPTVEINTTFYHYPRISVVQKWASNVPSNFIFSYKIPRVITHQKKLDEDYWNDLTRFIDIMHDGLQRKTGPALLQLPPKFSDKNFRKLEIFLKNWFPELRLAVEFRDISWIQQKRLNQTLNLLGQYNIAYCIVDEPLLPPITPLTADFTYLRFHGHGLRTWYNYQYSLNELQLWKTRLQKLVLNKNLKEIFCYFNNHPAGSAPANARQLAILLKIPLQKTKSINMAKVRKKVGELPKQSLEAFIDVSSININDYVRFCDSCGEMVLKNDNFCESCGYELEKDEKL